jgi:hypothetical protein
MQFLFMNVVKIELLSALYMLFDLRESLPACNTNVFIFLVSLTEMEWEKDYLVCMDVMHQDFLKFSIYFSYLEL